MNKAIIDKLYDLFNLMEEITNPPVPPKDIFKIEKIWLSEKEAEEYTGFERKTLQKARDESRLRFRVYKDGRKIIYKKKDLDAFIEKECTLYDTTAERIESLKKH